MAEDKEYREGDQAAPQPQAPGPETAQDSSDPTAPVASASDPEVPTEEEVLEEAPEEDVPEVAVLLVRHRDGRVEAITQLPGMRAVRPATMRDIRDLAQSVVHDITSVQTSQQAAQLISKGLGDVMTKLQVDRMRGQLSGSQRG